MPTRVMYWNIENFGINKFFPTAYDANSQRGRFIRRTIQQVNPDILVVVEVQTGNGNGEGNLVTMPAGGNGTILLKAILGVDIPGQWSFVPPLISGAGGQREGIAVFFKNNVVNFAGPYKWLGAGGGQGAVPVNSMANAVAYGGPWNNALPAAAPVGPAINEPGGGALDQNELAGQWRFSDGNGGWLNFPTLGRRAPFLTTFREDLGGMAGRTINIYSYHAPPAGLARNQGTASIADIPALQAGPGANEVNIVLGDFNVNSLNPGTRPVYRHLVGGVANVARPAGGGNYPVINMHMTLNDDGFFGATWPPYQYNPTMVRRNTAGHANTGGANPFYDYIARFAGHRGALDNIFVLFGDGTIPNDSDVVNRVVGYPYPPVLPRYTIDMYETIPYINANYWVGAPRTNRFRTMINFGQMAKQRGASDHMALVIDI